MKKFYLFWLASKTTLSVQKPCSFFTQMIIWCVNNNILEDQNTYPIERWCSKLSKTRSGYLDLASKLSCFWKCLFSYYFNQGNLYADKIWRCSQHFRWKYPQKSLLGIFLDVTLFLNMITWANFKKMDIKISKKCKNQESWFFAKLLFSWKLYHWTNWKWW